MLGSDPWWRPFRVLGSITLVHVDLTPNVVRESAALGRLDEWERRRWSAFAYTARRRRFASCRAALGEVLASQRGCSNEQLAFDADQHGKPSATVGGRAAPIGLNVSHSGGHGLIASVPTDRVGVDVEVRASRHRLDLLVEATLDDSERENLASRPGSNHVRFFFRLWTMKEALLKAHGYGFLLDATSFEIPPAMRQGATTGTVELPQMPGVGWCLEDVGNEQFAAAIAYELSAQIVSRPEAT